MRIVLQRVSWAQSWVDGAISGEIGRGILVYLGVSAKDSREDAAWLAEKAARLRVFEDAEGLMNLSAADLGLGALVVSQFTLYADASKGRRPSYSLAAGAEVAKPLYEAFVEELGARLSPVRTGIFQAHMGIRYENDGPITIIVDSPSR
jgi:D-aminoacyl-tRNA deacylase